jgi:amidase
LKIVPKNKTVYTFDSHHKPVAYVRPGEPVLVRTEDAFGGQVKSEEDSLDVLDWSRVDGATGPIFVETAEVGDTLEVEILRIGIENQGVVVTVPKCGILGDNRFKPLTRLVGISEGFVLFDSHVRMRLSPMIGTIGVTPREKIPTGSLGKHGGNMDVSEVTAGTKLYLPVIVKGALFAAGDLHAVQGDGELCVSAVEVAGEILLRFNLCEGRKPEWPILETKDSFAFLTCGETLDQAARFAAEATIKALMTERGWSFEKAYMFASTVVDLKINQVVNPRKGVRAVVSKDFVTLESLLT